MEVERKFLVAALPDLAGVPRTAIRQGYVAVAAGGDEVRVRDRDGSCTLTVKHGSGLVREEAEVPISPALFAELWALTDGRRVEKVRHLVPLDDVTAELDVFGGALEGLVTVEVEFPAAAAATAWLPPAWFGADVTGDDGYRNQVLATATAPPPPPER